MTEKQSEVQMITAGPHSPQPQSPTHVGEVQVATEELSTLQVPVLMPLQDPVPHLANHGKATTDPGLPRSLERSQVPAGVQCVAIALIARLV